MNPILLTRDEQNLEPSSIIDGCGMDDDLFEFVL